MRESGIKFNRTKPLKNMSQNDLLENWIIALLFLNVTLEIDILGSSICIRIDEMNSVFISEGFKCLKCVKCFSWWTRGD